MKVFIRNTNKRTMAWLMSLTMIFSCLSGMFPVQAMASESKPIISSAISAALHNDSTGTIANGIGLSWSAVDGSVNYAVYRQDAGVGEYVYIGASTELTYKDITVEASDSGKEYSYKVGSIDALGALSELSEASSNVKVYPPIGFDFGSGGVATGYNEIRGTKLYVGDAIYGVMAKTKGSALKEYGGTGIDDTLLMSQFDFYVEVPNGKYNVWLQSGNGSSTDKGYYHAGSIVGDRIATKNRVTQLLKDVEVTDGLMKIYYESAGGVGRINAIVITRTELYEDQTKPQQAPWYYSGSINEDKTQVTLTWDAPKGAESYKVYRKLSTAEDSAYTYLATVTDTTYTDDVTGLERKKGYDYVVTAYSSANGESAKTGKYTVTMPAPVYNEGTLNTALTVPTGLKAVSALTVHDFELAQTLNNGANRLGDNKDNYTFTETDKVVTKVKLDWEDVAGATAYNVYRKIGSDELEYLTRVDTSEYVDNVEVATEGEYTYAVATVIGDERSNNTSTISETLYVPYAYDFGSGTAYAGYTMMGNAESYKYTPEIGYGLVWKDGVTSLNVAGLKGGASVSHAIYNNLRFVGQTKFRQDVKNGVYNVWIIAGNQDNDTVSYVINDETKSDVTGRTINYLDYNVSVENGSIVVDGADGGYVGRTGALIITPLKYSPTNFTTVVAEDLSKATLTWDSVYSGENFYIFRAPIGTEDFQIIGEIASTTYVDSSVEIGEEYRYKVASKSVNGLYAYSEIKEIQVYDKGVTAPLAPTEIVPVRETASTAKLTWTAPVGATKYFIYRTLETDNNFELLTTTGDASFTDTGLEINKNYVYKLVASNRGGKSPQTGEILVKALIPEIPTNGKINTSTYASVVLSWDAIEGADGYKIYRAGIDEIYAEIADVTVSTYTDLTVSAEMQYIYKITAYNEGGESERTAAINVTTGKVPSAPIAPIGVEIAGATCTYVNVKWNNVIGATEYNIYRASSISGDYNLIASAVTEYEYKDTTAPENQTCFYKVTAVNAGGESQMSEAVEGKMLEAVYKFDFGSGAVADGYTQITTEKYVEGTTEYGFAEADSVQADKCGNGTPDALKNDACRVVYSSPAGITISFTVELENGNYALSVLAGLGSNYASTFAFKDAAGNSLCDTQGYSESNTWNEFVREVEITNGKLIVEITSGKTRVGVINALTIGKLPPSIPCEIPTGLGTSDTTSETTTLSWNAEANATSYNIYRAMASDGEFVKVASTSETSLVYNMRTTVPYYFKVSAVNSVGESALSDYVVSAVEATMNPYKENIGRALVAVQTNSGIFMSWRLLESDTNETYFNVYQAGTKIYSTGDTNYTFVGGDSTAVYKIVAVNNGLEDWSTMSMAKPLTQEYLSIALDVPESGVTPDGTVYSYRANDISIGDLDGDGEYEIILKWDPSNSHDNSGSGWSGPVFIDAYKMNGTKLWRVNLGVNIRAGAHYTQFMVYDFDKDGKAEMAVKTADGTVDGLGNVIGDPAADYRVNGVITSGPEYLTVFDGMTGKAVDTTNFIVGRENPYGWGKDTENYNRVDRFLATVAYLDGETPSFVMCRGYYGRTTLTAYNLAGGKIVRLWTFDSTNVPTIDGKSTLGQGNHNLTATDVDGDGCDEIIYGSLTIDNDGTAMYSTGLGHGDAMHVTDIDIDRPGLEVFQVHEDANAQYQIELHDAKTGEILWAFYTGGDTGRGVSADVDPNYRGAEAWAKKSGIGGLMDAKGNIITPDILIPSNFTVLWDGDLLSEMYDGGELNVGASNQATPYIYKYMDAEGNLINAKIKEFDGTTSNNHTKGNPCLVGDILGDWREEVIVRSIDSSELRIYSTVIPTEYRLTALVQDHQYRMALAWQNVAYNQPPHTSYYIGTDMKITTNFTGTVPEVIYPPVVDEDDEQEQDQGQGSGTIGTGDVDDSRDNAPNNILDLADLFKLKDDDNNIPLEGLSEIMFSAAAKQKLLETKTSVGVRIGRVSSIFDSAQCGQYMGVTLGNMSLNDFKNIQAVLNVPEAGNSSEIQGGNNTSKVQLKLIGNLTHTLDITLDGSKNTSGDVRRPVGINIDLCTLGLEKINTSKLTLISCENDKIVPIGGYFDAETKTFNAHITKTGKYLLAEIPSLTKLKMTIGSNVLGVNDNVTTMDVLPKIINDRTMLPARAFAEALGIEVGWNDETREVIFTLKDGTIIKVSADKEIEGYGKPVFENDRTLFPLRYLAELFNAYVLWLPDTQEVEIVK